MNQLRSQRKKVFSFLIIKNLGRFTYRTFLILFCFGLLATCKKEKVADEESNNKHSILSKNRSDYQARLSTLKTNFYTEKLELKLSKKDDDISWAPDWEHPKSQIVNDSVSYVFYKLIPKIIVEGKIVTAKVGNFVQYLIVKNEKEYFRGFYYQPNKKVNLAAQPEELSIENFTGRLILKALATGKDFSIDYDNGRPNALYYKKALAVKKLQSTVPPTSSYWVQQCRTEVVGCIFRTGSYLCAGQIWIEYVPDCQWPSYCQNAVWILDWEETREVCENFWFPDAPNDPTDPNNPGGPGPDEGDPGGLNMYDIIDAQRFDDGQPKIQDIKKYTKCFNDGKTAQSYTMTIYAEQPVPGQSDWFEIITPSPGVVRNNAYNIPTGVVFQTPNGQYFNVGHTFVTFEKNNTDGSNVRQTLGFYPLGSGFASAGAMENNSYHDASVKWTMNVNQNEFNLALQKLESDFENKDYILTNINGDEYNCTDAAISWMNAAGANFGNSTSGLFKNTPGNFGQVLRNKPGAVSPSDVGIPGKGECN